MNDIVAAEKIHIAEEIGKCLFIISMEYGTIPSQCAYIMDSLIVHTDFDVDIGKSGWIAVSVRRMGAVVSADGIYNPAPERHAGKSRGATPTWSIAARFRVG